MAWWGKQLRKSLKSLSQFQCYFIPILAKEILAFPENLTFIWENRFFFLIGKRFLCSFPNSEEIVLPKEQCLFQGNTLWACLSKKCWHSKIGNTKLNILNTFRHKSMYVIPLHFLVWSFSNSGLSFAWWLLLL